MVRQQFKAGIQPPDHVGFSHTGVSDDRQYKRTARRFLNQQGVEDIFLGLRNGLRIPPEETSGEFHRLVDGEEYFFRCGLRFSDEAAHVVFVRDWPEIGEVHGSLDLRFQGL
jgi:hypothetical protein